VDAQRDTAGTEQSQYFQSQSPLDSLINDLRQFRDHSIAKDRRRRSSILAGQVLILALQYKTGRPPSRLTLKGFFYLLAKEQSA